MQVTLAREHVSMQGTFARKHVTTQYTSARKHVFSTQGRNLAESVKRELISSILNFLRVVSRVVKRSTQSSVRPSRNGPLAIVIKSYAKADVKINVLV